MPYINDQRGELSRFSPIRLSAYARTSSLVLKNRSEILRTVSMKLLIVGIISTKRSKKCPYMENFSIG